ncbi:thiol reductant ABC exporter subunit CydC [Ammonifex thiophilus]|uniref:Thiol reductant ABC exporter subunit CydC n=1 Tax=Ammonifex thiophilus TaxID=444093 RepID=A0A3D8P852_9THEO|nr:thiol reductant ABC exporter subunit CydC [Ammonifex thiophilus]RDV84887.1 thiol reductant ABC exporter subunit CydC [Ammonifex thiophilus]
MNSAPDFKAILKLCLPELALAAFLGFLAVASNVGLIGTATWLIATAALHPPFGDLFLATVAVRFFGVARAIFRYAERYLAHDATFRWLARLRSWFYARLEPLAPAVLHPFSSAGLLSTLVNDVQALENLYLRVLAPGWIALGMALSLFAFLFCFAPLLAWLFLFFALLLGAVLPIFFHLLTRRRSAEESWARNGLTTTLVEVAEGLREALVFDLVARMERKVAAWRRKLNRARYRRGGLEIWAEVVSDLFSRLALVSLLVVAVVLVQRGALPGVALAVLPLMVLTALEAWGPLLLVPRHYRESREATARILEVISAPSPSPSASSCRPDDIYLRLENLRFRYLPEGPWVLDGVEFDLPPGRKVALVGPSGAGKSTLLNLLLRLWDYQEGHIYLGGCELRSLPPEEVQRWFAVVPQQVYFFNATVRENLALARPGIELAEIERLARELGIHRHLLSLPQGFETPIGDRGFMLSGGERQRLAILRALLKNAPILLLDEPTAGLDPVSARDLFYRLLEKAEGRTLLLITHRPLALELMDEIVVLDRGRVVDRGKHCELLPRCSIYRHLWERHGLA